MDRDLHDLQVQRGGPEYEIEVAERVEVAKISAIDGNLPVVGPELDLRATECVGNPAAQEIREDRLKNRFPIRFRKRIAGPFIG